MDTTPSATSITNLPPPNGFISLQVVLTLIFSVLGLLSPSSRGSIVTGLILLFVFMGAFAGYFSSTFPPSSSFFFYPLSGVNLTPISLHRLYIALKLCIDYLSIA